ncbi:AAA family ATPase [Mariprofundus sp. EBB-1]|uniref:IS21-like element helper ATPase IstB n=1 Tax=Mariprofundus sp. EBB-1 TaxID=2650971 RepID=UPI000EF19333|nr:IS21-like element helper ATPase IstB [Mariprofundus sp. EBB-1]RLL48953.1 AAA family ATPase [Mariprofundus sp. EBB-1]
MLTHPILDEINTLKLTGMHKALSEQLNMPEVESMDFMARLGLMVDRETSERANRRLQTRLKKAKLRQQACFEDIDFRTPRGLDKQLILSLASCDWIKKANNILLTGATGTGKSYLACALAHKSCLEGHTVRYMRLPRLMEEIGIARADGSYGRLMMDLARTDLIILDDWGLAAMTKPQRNDLLEILEDRNGLKSTIVTSQLPVEAWHEYIGDPTLADAILDRLVHSAYKINLKGESMRKKNSTLTIKKHPAE